MIPLYNINVSRPARVLACLNTCTALSREQASEWIVREMRKMQDEGHSYKEIARGLGVRPSVVHYYLVQRAYRQRRHKMTYVPNGRPKFGRAPVAQ